MRRRVRRRHRVAANMRHLMAIKAIGYKSANDRLYARRVGRFSAAPTCPPDRAARRSDRASALCREDVADELPFGAARFLRILAD